MLSLPRRSMPLMVRCASTTTRVRGRAIGTSVSQRALGALGPHHEQPPRPGTTTAEHEEPPFRGGLQTIVQAPRMAKVPVQLSADGSFDKDAENEAIRQWVRAPCVKMSASTPQVHKKMNAAKTDKDMENEAIRMWVGA